MGASLLGGAVHDHERRGFAAAARTRDGRGQAGDRRLEQLGLVRDRGREWLEDGRLQRRGEHHQGVRLGVDARRGRDDEHAHGEREQESR